MAKAGSISAISKKRKPPATIVNAGAGNLVDRAIGTGQVCVLRTFSMIRSSFAGMMPPGSLVMVPVISLPISAESTVVARVTIDAAEPGGFDGPDVDATGNLPTI